MQRTLKLNWYVKFDNLDNVYALIPRRVQAEASSMALSYGAQFGANHAQLTLLKGKEA